MNEVRPSGPGCPVPPSPRQDIETLKERIRKLEAERAQLAKVTATDVEMSTLEPGEGAPRGRRLRRGPGRKHEWWLGVSDRCHSACNVCLHKDIVFKMITDA